MNELDTLTNCPKCGFEQPVDTYCAKCGVDMTTLPKKSPSLATKPAVLAGGAAVLIIVTLIGIRALRSDPSPTARTASALASESVETRRERLSAKAPTQLREHVEQHDHATAPVALESTASDFVAEENTNDEARAKAPATGAGTLVAANTATAPSAAQAASPGSAAAASVTAASSETKTAGDTASQNLPIAFVWAEVSREFLQTMGGMGPGVHPVPDLEARLREVPNAYRIVDRSRQVLETTGALRFDLNRGDRIATHFEIGAFNGTSFSGTVQTSIRTPDGAIRTPPPLPLALDKDQGGILTIGGPGSGLGPNPTGAEIVVLILPRWGADRNP